MFSQCPPEAADRAVPGHWEGDLILRVGSLALGTLWIAPLASLCCCICRGCLIMVVMLA